MEILLPKEISAVITALEEYGAEAYVVGGCVRDSLLEREINDWDVTTSASTEEMRRCFAGKKLIATGEKHGTMTLLSGEYAVEITTFRKDGNYSDGRHPDSVVFSDRLTDDLSRRDFTVNAMAYNPARGLTDRFSGREDLQNGIIRCVGDAQKRFNEDALRILRAFRFMSKLKTAEGKGFVIENATLAAMESCKERISLLSVERVTAELAGIITAERAGETLALMKKTDILSQIPSFEACDAGIERIDKLPKELETRTAALFWSISAEQAKERLAALKFKNSEIKRIAAFLENVKTALTSDIELLELTAKMGAEDAFRLFELRRIFGDGCAEKSKQRLCRLLEEGRCFKTEQLAVNGKDMAELGFEGRAIGTVLGSLLREVMAGAENSRENLLQRAKQFKEEQ